MVKAEYPISFKLFGKDIFFKAPHPQKAESLMEVSLLDKSNKNKDERMRKSDRFMTKMNYEWRTFRETNSDYRCSNSFVSHKEKVCYTIHVLLGNTIYRGCFKGGFRNGKQDNSSNRNEQFHRNSKESLLLY